MSARPQYSNLSQATSSTDGSVESIPRVYPTAKRVVVPATVRATTGVLNPQSYRNTYSQTYCNAPNRLESVVDDKEVVRRGIFDSAQRFCRTADKSRGLRHFSTKVCEKVKEKGRTNYNEVADELVSEYFDSLTTPPQSSEKQQYDMKNIRRRVYDALNVLMAMNVIEKEKKEIRWVGLPTSSSQECRRLEDEKLQRQESIRRKTEQLQELIIQLVAYKTLVQRNRDTERKEGRGPSESMIFLPFIVVNTNKETVVDCSIASDKTEFIFHFDQPFEIHDDIEILKRLGLAFGLDKGDVPEQYVEHIRKCLPPALRGYADQIIDGTLLSSLTPPPPVAKISIPEKK
uniref:Transcription factor n=1 Tax=Panagrolaimus sp. JU765 TaxID=591449 RepID=A0AC34QGF0_9BILA